MEEDKCIKWNILIDRKNLVEGVALVKKGFKAELHYHAEEEEYIFLYGTGLLYINGETTIVNSPKRVLIQSNIIHAMTPLSDYVILLFRFKKGKFKNIKYTYTNKFIENRFLMNSKL